MCIYVCIDIDIYICVCIYVNVLHLSSCPPKLTTCFFLKLYALYLAPSNANLLADLYLPSSPLLRHPLRHTLRNAATAEILKTTRGAVISPPQLYADATEALAALSTLLGDDDWFFASDDPALFDAEVFSYTYLILDESLAWQDTRLAECLSQFENLVRHRERLYQKYWTTL